MSEIAEQVYVFVMAGGAGERFWPLSRTQTPKHLLRLFGERTLLEETLLRFEGLVPWERVYVLTNRRQVEGCRDAVPWLPWRNFLAEPEKRDTAPACALATGWAMARGGGDAVCGLFPADAMVGDVEKFRRNFVAGVELARREETLVTFGVSPAYPATGFGYLELAEELGVSGGSRARRVRRFVEKPDKETAERYVASGNFAWNAGMFVWRAGVFLEEARRSSPELAGFVEDFPGEEAKVEGYVKEVFVRLPKISVDYAIMEKARAVASVMADFDWDDVGTWLALPRHLGADAEGNTVRGEVVCARSRGCIGLSSGRVIALCGVENLVVVETEDAVLVCSREEAERIKELQPLLPERVR